MQAEPSDTAPCRVALWPGDATLLRMVRLAAFGVFLVALGVPFECLCWHLLAFVFVCWPLIAFVGFVCIVGHGALWAMLGHI